MTAQRTLTRGIDKLAAINKKGIENANIIRYAAAKISCILEKLGDI